MWYTYNNPSDPKNNVLDIEAEAFGEEVRSQINTVCDVIIIFMFIRFSTLSLINIMLLFTNYASLPERYAAFLITVLILAVSVSAAWVCFGPFTIYK